MVYFLHCPTGANSSTGRDLCNPTPEGWQAFSEPPYSPLAHHSSSQSEAPACVNIVIRVCSDGSRAIRLFSDFCLHSSGGLNFVLPADMVWHQRVSTVLGWECQQFPLTGKSSQYNNGRPGLLLPPQAFAQACAGSGPHYSGGEALRGSRGH